MKDCKYVLGAPLIFGKTDDAEVMAKPAIEGIQRILRAAEHAGVKRGDDCKASVQLVLAIKIKIQSQMKVIGQMRNKPYQYMKNQNC